MFWHILGAQLPTCALTSVFRPYRSQQYDVVLPPIGGGFVNIKNHIMPEGFVSNLPHSPKNKRGNMTIPEDNVLDAM